MEPWIAVVIAVATFVLGGGAAVGIFLAIPAFRKKAAGKEADKIIKDAERQGQGIIAKSRLDAKEITLEAKRSADKLIADARVKASEVKGEAVAREQEIKRREQSLEAREKSLDSRKEALEARIEAYDRKTQELEEKISGIIEELEKVAGLSVKEAREEIMTMHDGDYSKGRYEDLFSMIRGLREYKGNVHITFGDVLTGEWTSPDDVAAEIDRQIHAGYRLWPTNWFSYDYLNGDSSNSEEDPATPWWVREEQEPEPREGEDQNGRAQRALDALLGQEVRPRPVEQVDSRGGQMEPPGTSNFRNHQSTGSGGLLEESETIQEGRVAPRSDGTIEEEDEERDEEMNRDQGHGSPIDVVRH